MNTETRSAQQVVTIFKEKPELIEKLKTDPNPLNVIQEVADTAKKETAPYEPLVYRVAIFALVAIAVITLVGSLVAAFVDVTVPEVVVALGSAAVGALVGIFTPSPVK